MLKYSRLLFKVQKREKRMQQCGKNQTLHKIVKNFIKTN